MDRGTWQATVNGIERAGYNLVTKLQAHKVMSVLIYLRMGDKFTVHVCVCAESLQWCPTLQPTRLHRPWDSPGKNTGVGCHFLLQKETISKVKRPPSEWEKIIANETTDKELISKIYKHLMRLNTQKNTKNLIKTDQKTSTDTSPKKTYRWPTHEKMLNIYHY